MVRRRREHHPQAWLLTELINQIGHIFPGGKHVLKALQRKTVTNRALAQLGDFLVVSKAHQVVIIDDVLDPHQQRGHVAAAILDEANNHVVGKVLGRFPNFRRFFLTADRDDDVGAGRHSRHIGQKFGQYIQVIHVQHHGDFQIGGVFHAGRVHRAGGEHVGELQIVHQVHEVHGPQRIVPNQVHIVVGVVTQIFIEVTSVLPD